MKFLLVNENVAVRKLFSISAKKADIKLDIVDTVAHIPMQEDYSYIFVDDGVVDIDSIRSLRNKMITTKFCLILSKSSSTDGKFSNFDKYIRKPFLPIDIYEVLKKEKYNDINFGSSYGNASSDNVNISVADSEIHLDNNLLRSADTSDMAINDINAPINDVDLSDFNDNQDEFITGTTNKLDYTSVENSNYEFINDIGIMPSEMQSANNTQEKVGDLVSNSYDENIITDNESFGANDNVKSNKSDNDIDFSSVFALQDEILRTQEHDTRRLVGGDISVRKNYANNVAETNDINYENSNDSVDIDIDTQQDAQSNTEHDDNTNVDMNYILDNNTQNNFIRDDILDDNVSDCGIASSNIYNIENMSEQELEALDDETLIKLQENIGVDNNETMILDKSVIDEVNNMLDQTENYDDVKISGQDFNYLTEEALNEVLHEDINEEINPLKNNFSNKIDSSGENLKNNNQTNKSVPLSPNINMNGISDITEIIKAFPVDKLRELLSGAQITINITFPSKSE